jgi:hypothetical protein
VLVRLTDEDPGCGVLSFCGRCEIGNIGSGCFFDLLSDLKSVLDVGDFFGVVEGLDCETRSPELRSDLEDSDCRCAHDPGAPIVPLKVWLCCNDDRGEPGSSKGARDRRRRSAPIVSTKLRDAGGPLRAECRGES